jgi:hypothetical protein
MRRDRGSDGGVLHARCCRHRLATAGDRHCHQRGRLLEYNLGPDDGRDSAQSRSPSRDSKAVNHRNRSRRPHDHGSHRDMVGRRAHRDPRAMAALPTSLHPHSWSNSHKAATRPRLRGRSPPRDSDRDERGGHDERIRRDLRRPAVGTQAAGPSGTHCLGRKYWDWDQRLLETFRDSEGPIGYDKEGCPGDPHRPPKDRPTPLPDEFHVCCRPSERLAALRVDLQAVEPRLQVVR